MEFQLPAKHECVQIYLCMYNYMYVCMHVCMNVFIYIDMHVLY